MLSKSEQRAILKADSQRRQDRELRETAELVGITLKHEPRTRKRYAHVNPELVRGIGVVSPPLKVRASERWTGTLGTQPHRTGRTIGVAPGTTSNVPTVAVTRNGITEIVPASRFGNKRESARKTRTRAASTVTEPMHTSRIQSDRRDIAAMADGTA